MKKPSTFIFGAIMGIIICISLNGVGTTNTNCNLDVFNKSNIISVVKAKEIYDTYSTRRDSIIRNYEIESQGDTSFVPSRYGSYNFDSLKNYISYLDCIDQKIRSSSNGTNSLKSVRFYFTCYPDSTHFKNGDPMVVNQIGGVTYSLKGRSNFIMLPTTNFGTKEKGFVYDTNTNGVIQLIEIDTDSSTKFTSLIFNEVGLIPPPSSSVENDFE